MWPNVDTDMANTFADNLGVERSQVTHVTKSRNSPLINMTNASRSSATQKVAVLIGEGYNHAEISDVLDALKENNAFIDIIGEKLGNVTANDGNQLIVEETIKTKLPVLYDAVYIVGGNAVNKMEFHNSDSFFIDPTWSKCPCVRIIACGLLSIPNLFSADYILKSAEFSRPVSTSTHPSFLLLGSPTNKAFTIVIFTYKQRSFSSFGLLI